MRMQQLDDRVSVSRSWFPKYHFHLVDSVEKLKKLVDICIEKKIYSIDLETSGVDNRIYTDDYFGDGIVTRHGVRTVDRVVGVCMSFDGLHGYYTPLSHEPEDSGNLPWDPAWDEIERLCHAEGTTGVLHHAKFDLLFLQPLINKAFWHMDEFEDTFLLYRTLMSLKKYPAGLKQLSKEYCGIEMVELDELFTPERKDQLRRDKRSYNFGLLHPREGLEYGASDGIFTFQLFQKLKEKLRDCDPQTYKTEKSFCGVLRKMETTRVHIDVGRVEQLRTECMHALESVSDLIRNIIEMHSGNTGRWRSLKIGSPKQLSQCFFSDPEGIGIKPTKKMLEDDAYEQSGNSSQDMLSDDGDDEDDENSKENDGEKIWSLKDEALKSLHEDYGKTFSVIRNDPKARDKNGDPVPESIFELIIEWRHYEKMKGSFLDKLFLSHDIYGDVRPNFNQMGTDTARLSSTAGKIEQGYSGINFQGIPRDSDEDKPELFKQIRTCIIARPGFVLVKLDYAGEELRVVTNMSGDKVWTNSFLHEDGDVHSITARILFGKDEVNKDERNRGKRSNFAFIYGGGAGAIQRNVNGAGGAVCSMEDAQRHMNNLRKGVPELMGYIESQKQFARKHGCIYTAFGRRIPIPTITSPIRKIRAKAERCAINFTIQATSADVIKLAMCYVDKNIRELGWDDRVKYVLTVHDEVVFEVRPEYLMEIVPKLNEWMVKPWELQKLHGREWVVPLETEPGIDLHWRARFDFNKMHSGTPVQKKDLDENGKFIGKVKSGYHYRNGRIYQDIPDFLVGHIIPNYELPPAPESPKLPEISQELPALNPVSDLPSAEIAPVLMDNPPVEAEEPVIVPPPPSTPAPPLDVESIRPTATGFDSPDGEIDIGTEAPVSNIQLTRPDPILPSVPLSSPIPSPNPSVPTVQKGANGIALGQTVHRWTFSAIPSEYNQRKLHAILMLSEGTTPLRVINAKGDVLIQESEGICVNPAEFDMLVKLMGV